MAIYSEFGFQGAVVADNVIDGAETGISVTNFNEGGRLATVRGNIVRNLRTQRGRARAGNGISVEADTVVSGNVIEGAPLAGISRRLGQYLRNVAITGNVVRDAGYGVAVSVVGRCRRGDDFRQCVRRNAARRHCRHGMAQGGDRRPRACRRRALSEFAHQRQSGELTATFQAGKRYYLRLMPATRPSRRKLIMLAIFAVFLAPLIARAALYAAGNDPRSWRDADWSSTGMLPQAARLQAGARDRVHRQGRRLEGHFRGA